MLCLQVALLIRGCLIVFPIALSQTCQGIRWMLFERCYDIRVIQIRVLLLLL